MGMLKYRDASGQFVDLLWPIGSIYCSTKPGSPAGIYGGTWGAIIGAVLRGNAQSGVYSGSDTHTLTVDEIPPHRHLMPWGTVVATNASTGSGVSSLSDWGGGHVGRKHRWRCGALGHATFLQRLYVDSDFLNIVGGHNGIH